MRVTANLVGSGSFSDVVAIGVGLDRTDSDIRGDCLFFGDGVKDRDLSIFCQVKSDEIFDLFPTDNLDVVSVCIGTRFFFY